MVAAPLMDQPDKSGVSRQNRNDSCVGNCSSNLRGEIHANDSCATCSTTIFLTLRYIHRTGNDKRNLMRAPVNS